jgi:hypothetical protein
MLGDGSATAAKIQRELVEKRHWLTEERASRWGESLPARTCWRSARASVGRFAGSQERSLALSPFSPIQKEPLAITLLASAARSLGLTILPRSLRKPSKLRSLQGCGRITATVGPGRRHRRQAFVTGRPPRPPAMEGTGARLRGLQVLPMASARASETKFGQGDDVGTSHGSESTNAARANARVRASDNTAFVRRRRRPCYLLFLRWLASVGTGLRHEDFRLAGLITRNVHLGLHDKTGVIA